MRAIRHVRIQHPVGHGFFHSAALEWPGSDKAGFTYVVDCGGQGPDKGPLRRSIDLYRRWNKHPRLDLLFLTHLHGDHVNGLTQLMAAREVGAVVLPYLSPFERLAIFIESKVGSSGAAVDPDSYRLLIDPAERLFELGATSVSYIHARGHDDPPRHDLNVQDSDNSDAITSEGNLELSEPPVISGGLYTGVSEEPSGRAPSHRRDHESFRLKAGPTLLWQFSTFVQPNAGALQRFEQELHRRLPEIAARLANPSTRREALVEMIRPGRLRRGLRAAYDAAVGSGKLNATSLSVLSTPGAPRRWAPLSGPLAADLDVTPWAGHEMPWPRSTHEYREILRMYDFLAGRRGWPRTMPWWIPPGWMGLGDGELGAPENVAGLVQHFGSSLAAVGTIALPHHGSIHNYHPRLIDEVRPRYAVVSCSRGDTKHPAEPVAVDLRARGVHLVRVDQASDPLVQRFELVV